MKIKFPTNFMSLISAFFSIISGIFVVNVFSHYYSYTIAQLALIYVISVIIGFLILFNVLPYVKRYPVIFAFILLIAVFIVGNYKISSFNKDYEEKIIEIAAAAEKNTLSNAYEIYINSITVNEDTEDLSKIQLSDGWELKDGVLFNAGNLKNSITIVVPNARETQIEFATHQWCGIVNVNDGSKNYSLDLYSPNLDYTTLYIEGEKKANIYLYMPTLLCIFILLSFVIMVLIKIINNIDSQSVYFFILILVIRCIYAIIYEINYYPDSYSYINYDFNALLHLDFSNGRTFVYPLFLKIFNVIFGNDLGLLIAVFAQDVISYISVLYFYKAAMLITQNYKIIKIITFMFGTSRTVISWNHDLLTESLALSGTVFFMYFLIGYLKNSRTSEGIKAVGILTVLIFLRPSFLLFNIIVFVFLIIRLILHKANTSYVMAACLLSWGIILVYSTLFYLYYGIFTISDPVPRQLMVICIDRDYYKNSDNTELIEMIDSQLNADKSNTWSVVWNVLSYYGHAETQKIAKECIRNNFSKYILDEIEITCNEVFLVDFYPYYLYKDNANPTLIKWLDIYNKAIDILKPLHAFVIGIAMIIITVIRLSKKTFSWLICGLGIFVIGIFISTMVGTCSEWIRTMIHIIPVAYLSIIALIADVGGNENSFNEILRA